MPVVNTARLLLFLPLLHSASLIADLWERPREETVLSDDGSKQVHVVPLGRTNANLTVYALTNGLRTVLWSVRTENVPNRVFLPNTGSNVITTDSWGRVGYGEYVVAIYSPTGSVANYSLEEIAPAPAPDSGNSLLSVIDPVGYRHLFKHTTSSRWWQESSFSYFYPLNAPTNFCIWLSWRGGWIAFDLAKGKMVPLDKRALDAVNAKADAQVESDLLATQNHVLLDTSPFARALKFLTWRRHPEAVAKLESVMRSRSFSAGFGSINCEQAFFGTSEARELADLLLAQLKGHQTSRPAYGAGIHLGCVEGTLNFAQSVGRKGALHIYLVPVTSSPDNNEVPLEHSFTCSFEENNEKQYHGRKFLFSLNSIAPGDYRIRVVHDFVKPFAAADAPDASAGDYVSDVGVPITVKEGECTSVGVINCKTRVKAKRRK